MTLSGPHAFLSLLLALGPACQSQETPEQAAAEAPRPNLLFCIADDWGWPHAGAYGDEVVPTPHFDRVAREGVLFERAYVSSPSCTPSRNAILTGQDFWRLAEGASLHSTLQREIPVYPQLLAEAGYHVGHWRKSWGPGRLKPGGWADEHPAGPRYGGGLEAFLDARPEGAPFCFWLGASDPHRPYKRGTGAARGLDLARIELPGYWPDEERVRSDVADYYHEVARFDGDVGAALDLLEARGELDETVVIVTGDHGMPFPRCKSNLYEWGVHVPLAIRWGARLTRGRRVDGFVSLTDLAPTFLELAGLEIPEVMTGQSLTPLLGLSISDPTEGVRDHVVFGKERHVPSQPLPSMAGYPSRGLRTGRWLYIQNHTPDAWPAGIEDAEQAPMGWAFSDCDDGPTKTAVLDARATVEGARFFEWCLGRRPPVELYDVEADPHQLVNLAQAQEWAEQRQFLAALLQGELEARADPRARGTGKALEGHPYFGRSRRKR